LFDLAIVATLEAGRTVFEAECNGECTAGIHDDWNEFVVSVVTSREHEGGGWVFHDIVVCTRVVFIVEVTISGLQSLLECLLA
jgi:hypothetical protein